MIAENESQAPIETTDLRFLEARLLQFHRHGARLRLTVEGDRSYLSVSVIPAFPLSDPQRYLSVRDAADTEIGILADARALGDESRRLVEEDLERRYIVPVVLRVLALKERFGTIDWTVETDRGTRRFTTRNLRENVVQPAPNRYLIADVDGNRFDVRDITALDGASQAWLLRHI